LRRIRQTVTVVDTPEVRGMINASRHLFRVEEA
jgi:ribosomal protein L30/L7E